jgi:hypothetical protein
MKKSTKTIITEDANCLSVEIDSVNRYLSFGNARGRAHSKAAIFNEMLGYFFITSVDVGGGTKKECIMFSTLGGSDLLITDLEQRDDGAHVSAKIKQTSF